MTELIKYQDRAKVDSDSFIESSPRIILTFMLIQFIGLFFFGGFRTIYPIILELLFNFTEQEVISSWSAIYTVGLIIAFATRIPMGVIVDRYSRRKSLTLGFLLCFVALLGILYAENILVLSLLFGLLRTGAHAFPLVSRSYVGETNPGRQGRLNSLILLAGNTGSLLGPILLSLFLEISLQWLIWLSCGILILSNVAFALTVPPGKEYPFIALKARLETSASEIWKLKTVVLIFTLSGVISGINETVKVPYAYYVLDLSPVETGFLVGLVQLSSIAIIFVGGISVDRFGVTNLIIIGTGLEAIAGMLILLASKSILVFFIGQILLQGGILVVITASVTAITIKVSNSTVSTSFSIATSFFFLGSALVPLVTGELYLLDTSYPYLVIFTVGILLVLFYCLGFFQKRLKH